LGVLGASHVELEGKQLFLLANRRRNPSGVTAGGDDGVPGSQGGLRDVGAQASGRSGD
jgi:hypothetical protein